VYVEVNGPIPHPRNTADYVDIKIYFRVNAQSAAHKAKIVTAELIN
jgi:hypothetical protein